MSDYHSLFVINIRDNTIAVDVSYEQYKHIYNCVNYAFISDNNQWNLDTIDTCAPPSHQFSLTRLPRPMSYKAVRERGNIAGLQILVMAGQSQSSANCTGSNQEPLSKHTHIHTNNTLLNVVHPNNDIIFATMQQWAFASKIVTGCPSIHLMPITGCSNTFCGVKQLKTWQCMMVSCSRDMLNPCIPSLFGQCVPYVKCTDFDPHSKTRCLYQQNHTMQTLMS